MAITEHKTRVPIGDGWDLWIINRGPQSEVVLSFTDGAEGPVRERITIHLSQSKAVQVARALAGITFVPPIEDAEDEPTDPA